MYSGDSGGISCCEEVVAKLREAALLKMHCRQGRQIDNVTFAMTVDYVRN